MHERSDQMYLAASLYYVQGETMESIARQLRVSRSTVSRLLRDARDTGVVTITLRNPSGQDATLSDTFARIFGVIAHIVGVREGSTEVHRLDRVARVAGQLITSMIEDDMTIGAAWGTTLSAVVPYVRPRDLHGVSFVQLNGGGNMTGFGTPYVGSIISQMADSFGAEVVDFPVPAFFDHPETRQAMFRERSVQNVRRCQRKADLALFGVGSLASAVPSHVYSAGYLDDTDMAQLRADRAVGDVNTVLLREDGTWADIALNQRASGMTPPDLQRIPRRLCVVAGVGKASPLLGLLRARLATEVVVDEATAKTVLAKL